MSTRLTCPACGYDRTYEDDARAAGWFNNHSCATQLQRASRPHRGRTPGERRDCHHTKARHRHGTRLAYVADRCRCGDCRAANTADLAQRDKNIAYGRHAGLVDAAPVREHVMTLRKQTKLSYRRLAELAGISPGIIDTLIYPDPTRSQGRKIRATNANKLLTLTADRLTWRVPAEPTKRRLQALIAAGWSQPRLVRHLRRGKHTIRQTLAAAHIPKNLADAVARMYTKLAPVQPPQRTPAEKAAVAKTRTYARQRGWLPPNKLGDGGRGHTPTSRAWRRVVVVNAVGAEIEDSNDDEPAPLDPDNDIDEIAVERAMHGDPVPLNHAERALAVQLLTKRGISIRQIAERLHITERTVERHRKSAHRAA